MINFGESVTLVWDVVDSNRVILRYPGGEEDVPAQGSKTVAPELNTQYSLFAASPVGQSEAATMVEVTPLISAPTPDPGTVDSAASGPLPTATWTPTWTPSPVATETATSTPMPSSTVAAPEVPTDTPALTPTATSLPAIAQAQSPLVITIVVTPEIQAGPESVTHEGPTAPAIVLLDPVDSSAVSEGRRADDASFTAEERNFMIGGLSLVVGTPIVFGGIWLVLWLTWRRR